MSPDYAHVDRDTAKAIFDRAMKATSADDLITSITYHGVDIPMDLFNCDDTEYDTATHHVHYDCVIVNVKTKRVWIRYAEKHTNDYFEIRVGFE